MNFLRLFNMTHLELRFVLSVFVPIFAITLTIGTVSCSSEDKISDRTARGEGDLAPDELVTDPNPTDKTSGDTKKVVEIVAIPEFALWESQMLTYGEKTATSIKNDLDAGKTDPALSNSYYDVIRVFYNIAEYTNDDKWLGYVPLGRAAYRDNYVLTNDGGIPGYWNFTHGMRIDFQKAKDALSKEAVISLSENAAFARDTTNLSSTVRSGLSREVAYSIMAYINAEILGEPHRSRLNDLFLQALAHIDKWFIDEEDSNWAPFMFGLTAEALIFYWDNIDKDPRILEKLKFGVDEIWKRAWIADKQAFFYRAEEPTKTAADLNLLIAPIFSWLYLQTGDAVYRDRGDQVFAGGVKGAWLDGCKQFNQSYRWSFDYLKWRNMAEATK